MKNTNKKLSFPKITLSILTFGFLAQADLVMAQTEGVYTKTKLSYEVDGMDVWELPAPRTEVDVQEAVSAFKNRCAEAVPAFYYKKIDDLRLSQDDFKITTESYKFFIRGYGDSHRCRMTAEIKKRDYSFVNKKTPSYYNTKDISAYDQCKNFRDGLDARALEMNLFDRIIQLGWGKINGKPAVVSCFVTYTTIKF